MATKVRSLLGLPKHAVKVNGQCFNTGVGNGGGGGGEPYLLMLY